MKSSVIETIVAAATPPGRGGIAVIRVSGPLVKSVAEKVLGKLPAPRLATMTPFLDENQETIDEGIALFFPNPHSFTGEDVLELQGHGGPVIVDCLIQRILRCGARLARPGEFSERAFLNDKLDLVQAEAIADLIDAASLQAAQSALRSLQGEFSNRIAVLVEGLIYLRTFIEAAIDFVDEEIDFLGDQQVMNRLNQLLEDLTVTEKAAQQGSLLREGIYVVIAGEPNVGKSSLINALSGKDIAIVTDIAGTTRDVLRQEINIEGMPLHIVDTAGLRHSDDVVEREGIRRAYAEIEKADFILLVKDASKTSATDDLALLVDKIPGHAEIITIYNKIDLIDSEPSLKQEQGKITIGLSAKNQDGIELLKNHIKQTVGLKTTSEGTFSARRRHLDALARAKVSMEQAKQQLLTTQAGELIAEELRQAQLALNEITGEFTADDLLGKIFSSFCIGK